eukprot:scaffold193574_cov31-Tisochrysis_lutea.AAC.2
MKRANGEKGQASGMLSPHTDTVHVGSNAIAVATSQGCDPTCEKRQGRVVRKAAPTERDMTTKIPVCSSTINTEPSQRSAGGAKSKAGTIANSSASVPTPVSVVAQGLEESIWFSTLESGAAEVDLPKICKYVAIVEGAAQLHRPPTRTLAAPALRTKWVTTPSETPDAYSEGRQTAHTQ